MMKGKRTALIGALVALLITVLFTTNLRDQISRPLLPVNKPPPPQPSQLSGGIDAPAEDLLDEVLFTPSQLATGGRAQKLWAEFVRRKSAFRALVDKLTRSGDDRDRIVAHALRLRLFGLETGHADEIVADPSPRVQASALREIYLIEEFAAWESLVERVDQNLRAGTIELLWGGARTPGIPPIAEIWGIGRDLNETAYALLGAGGAFLSAAQKLVLDEGHSIETRVTVLTGIAEVGPPGFESYLRGLVSAPTLSQRIRDVAIFELGQVGTERDSLVVLKSATGGDVSLAIYGGPAADSIASRLATGKTRAEHLADVIQNVSAGWSDHHVTELFNYINSIKYNREARPSAAITREIPGILSTKQLHDVLSTYKISDIRYMQWKGSAR